MNNMKTYWIIRIIILSVGYSSIEAIEIQESTSIAAFNIQVFGVSKASKSDVMTVLEKILQKYDITFIQEIRDRSNKAIHKLVDQIQSKDKKFEMVLSSRLGSSSAKEQYAYIFRKDKGIKILKTYQHPELEPNKIDRTFERPPFAAWFHIPGSEIQNVAIIGVHIDPDLAVEEIDNLVKVHDIVRKMWKIDNIIIMGDLNADCSYLSNRNKKSLALREELFHWLIEDDEDTTVKPTDCAYDRFIVSGDDLYSSILKESVGVFHFDKEYSLDAKQAAAVSDHYPIHMSIRNKNGGKSVFSKIKKIAKRVWDEL